MTPLLPRPQLVAHPLIHTLLRLFEPPQVVRISQATHFEPRIQVIFQFDAGSNAYGRRFNFLGVNNPVAAQIPKSILDKYITLW